MKTKLNQYAVFFVGPILAGGLCVLRADAAQDSLSDTESILSSSFHNDPKAVEECSEALGSLEKGIDSMSFVYEQNKPGDRYYEKFTWKEQTSGKCYYRLTSIQTGPGAFDIEEGVLFDGKRTYTDRLLDRYISIRHGVPALGVLNSFETPLLPFIFLQDTSGRVALSSLTAGSPELVGFKKKALYLGEQTYKGIACRVLRVTGLQDSELKEKVDYDVFLDKARGLFPIGWRVFDRDRVPIRSMFIAQLATLNGKGPNARFTYPAKYVIWTSKFNGTLKVNGKVVKYFPDESTRTFDHVSIDLNDSEFSFDPSDAATIFDEDAKSLISVPK